MYSSYVGWGDFQFLFLTEQYPWSFDIDHYFINHASLVDLINYIHAWLRNIWQVTPMFLFAGKMENDKVDSAKQNYFALFRRWLIVQVEIKELTVSVCFLTREFSAQHDNQRTLPKHICEWHSDNDAQNGVDWLDIEETWLNLMRYPNGGQHKWLWLVFHWASPDLGSNRDCFFLQVSPSSLIYFLATRNPSF